MQCHKFYGKLSKLFINMQFSNFNHIINEFAFLSTIYVKFNYLKLGGLYFFEKLNPNQQGSSLRRSIHYPCGEEESKNLTEKYDLW